MPHFALLTVDGESLGAIELGRHDWPPSCVIYRGVDGNLRVVDYIESYDPEKFTVLVVEPA